MPQYSLNNTVPEPDRVMDAVEFDNVGPAPTTGRPVGQGQGPAHVLEDQVVDSSDTIKSGFPAPSGSFARRTY